MKKHYARSFIASIFVIVCYVTFATIAFARFPLPYSPARNWLSDLGNPLSNPDGAAFYNIGVALTGLALLIFFLDLFRFRLENNKTQTLMTVLTALFGSVGAFGMLMSAVNPIHRLGAHSFWCMVLYISIGTAFAFSLAAFRYHSWYPRWLLSFGAIVVLFNLGTQIIFHDVCVLEWINVPLLLSYCLLLGVAANRNMEEEGV
jgi:hypothetical membrane protein